MKCQFCGWDNPDGKTTCEKCNKPLASSDAGSGNNNNEEKNEYHDRPTSRKPNSGFNPKATVREAGSGAVQSASEAGKCPDCGFGLEAGVCPNCGYTDETNRKSSVAAEMRKTVRPVRKSGKKNVFTLTPISETTGEPEGDALRYVGEEVSLNRDNTDPDNKTITSVCQAVVRNEDGKWNIEDGSEYKTTFVQAVRKIEISKGDFILLGNQLYRFDC